MIGRFVPSTSSQPRSLTTISWRARGSGTPTAALGMGRVGTVTSIGGPTRTTRPSRSARAKARRRMNETRAAVPAPSTRSPPRRGPEDDPHRSASALRSGLPCRAIGSARLVGGRSMGSSSRWRPACTDPAGGAVLEGAVAGGGPVKAIEIGEKVHGVQSPATFGTETVNDAMSSVASVMVPGTGKYQLVMVVREFCGVTRPATLPCAVPRVTAVVVGIVMGTCGALLYG